MSQIKGSRFVCLSKSNGLPGSVKYPDLDIKAGAQWGYGQRPVDIISADNEMFAI